MTSHLDSDLMPLPHPGVVDITLRGEDGMVECVRDSIAERAADGIGFVVEETDGMVRCRMQVVTPGGCSAPSRR
ncbi:hypothetical protein ACH5AL_38450 [Actinacidiphila glaucinigra]|uniref:hypothetical protein n=1 Tax=Actinacidiphila glaucinigra TaxID=235986 RepID=UPI00378CA186